MDIRLVPNEYDPLLLEEYMLNLQNRLSELDEMQEGFDGLRDVIVRGFYMRFGVIQYQSAGYTIKTRIKEFESTNYEDVSAHEGHIQVPLYDKPVETSSTESVNGYNLYDSSGPLVTKDTFQRVVPLFLSKDPEMGYDEFKTRMKDTCCSDWGKMDANGEPFPKEFWNDDVEEPWNLTLDNNCEKMYALPFPKAFLLWTIKHGCDRREESVRDSNFLGVWFSRKCM